MKFLEKSGCNALDRRFFMGDSAQDNRLLEGWFLYRMDYYDY